MKENKYTTKVTPKTYEDLDEVHGYITRDLYNFSANFILAKSSDGECELFVNITKNPEFNGSGFFFFLLLFF